MAIENNVIYISKNKLQPSDASSMTIIRFNITKSNNHDYTIFQNHDHPFMIVVMKMA
jgi:hypothetical protein